MRAEGWTKTVPLQLLHQHQASNMSPRHWAPENRFSAWSNSTRLHRGRLSLAALHRIDKALSLQSQLCTPVASANTTVSPFYLELLHLARHRFLLHAAWVLTGRGIAVTRMFPPQSSSLPLTPSHEQPA